MPKQSVTFDTFHGGLNLVSAERDILSSQLLEAKDCAVDKMGKITTLGGTVSQGTIDVNESSTAPGYGLFTWKTDYQRTVGASVKAILRVNSVVNGVTGAQFVADSHGFSDDDIVYVTGTRKYNGTYKIHSEATDYFYLKTLTGSDPVQYIMNDSGEVSSTNPASDDSFFALCDYKEEKVDIFSTIDGNWFLNEIKLGGTDPEAVYYAADGALRVCDRTFSSGSLNKWYGYIKRTLFKKSNTPFELEGFYQSNQELKPPSGKFNENQNISINNTSITTSNADYTFASGGQSATVTASDLNTDAGGSVKIGRLKVTLRIDVDPSYNPASNDDRYFDFIAHLKYGDSSSTTAVNSPTNSKTVDFEDNIQGVTSDERVVSIEFAGNTGPPTSGGQLNHTVTLTSEKGTAIASVQIVALEFFKETYTAVTYSVARGSFQFDFKFGVPASGKKGAYWDTKWAIGATFLYGEGATRQESMLGYLRNIDDSSVYIDGAAGTELGILGSSNDAAEGMRPDITLTFDYSGPYYKRQVTEDDATAVLLAEALDDSETAIDVDDGSGGSVADSVFQANDRIMIVNSSGGLNEVMKVSSISSSTVTVVRGSKLTAPAAHDNNAAIYNVPKSEWNPRVTGIKLYMKDIHNLEDKVWKPQIEYDFLKGVATVIRTGYEEDILYDTDDRYHCGIESRHLFEPNLVGNFETESGVDFDEKSVYSQYKTATIANGRVYVGNVNAKMRGQNRTVRMGDTIIKSPFNKFDIFPLSNRIDVAVNDGEHIIKLESFNDRLLCFKEETLYIINISQDIEFVEGVYRHRGVQHPAQVFKTNFGIAWANRIGIFLYDGQRVTDLTEKQGQKIIDWPYQLSLLTNPTPMVGYTPKSRQIIVIEDISTAGSFVWVYDLDTRSWVRGTNDTSHRHFDVVKTNFVIDYNDDLVFATVPNTTSNEDHTFIKWTDTPQIADLFDIKTKEIDFGNPAARKKIYAVHVTYKCGADSAADVDLVAQTSSGYTVYTFVAGTAGGSKSTLYGSQTLDSTGGVWKTAILKPSSSIKNIYSAYVRIRGSDVPATFAINDISIVYRIKPVK